MWLNHVSSMPDLAGDKRFNFVHLVLINNSLNVVPELVFIPILMSHLWNLWQETLDDSFQSIHGILHGNPGSNCLFKGYLLTFWISLADWNKCRLSFYH